MLVRSDSYLKIPLPQKGGDAKAIVVNELEFTGGGNDDIGVLHIAMRYLTVRQLLSSLSPKIGNTFIQAIRARSRPKAGPKPPSSRVFEGAKVAAASPLYSNSGPVLAVFIHGPV
jgi:hypothetical protein